MIQENNNVIHILCDKPLTHHTCMPVPYCHKVSRNVSLGIPYCTTPCSFSLKYGGTNSVNCSATLHQVFLLWLTTAATFQVAKQPASSTVL